MSTGIPRTPKAGKHITKGEGGYAAVLTRLLEVVPCVSDPSLHPAAAAGCAVDPNAAAYTGGESTPLQHVAVEHASGLPYARFVSQYMAPNVPVLIKGACQDWRALSEWVDADGRPNLPLLCKLAGHCTVCVTDTARYYAGAGPCRSLTFQEYADWWQQHQQEEAAAAAAAAVPPYPGSPLLSEQQGVSVEQLPQQQQQLGQQPGRQQQQPGQQQQRRQQPERLQHQQHDPPPSPRKAAGASATAAIGGASATAGGGVQHPADLHQLWERHWELLYLKDWHFAAEFPDYQAYQLPIYFREDWLNEYYDSQTKAAAVASSGSQAHTSEASSTIAGVQQDAKKLQQCLPDAGPGAPANAAVHDAQAGQLSAGVFESESSAPQPREQVLTSDYRFVYMGPRGTWTQLHSDVLRSYSWSANVCGRKRWLLLPPDHSHLLQDRHGHATAPDFDLTAFDQVLVDQFPGLGKAQQHLLECLQGPGDVLFVPSGWHHVVVNLDDVLSINHNWFNAHNCAWPWALLQRQHAEATASLGDCRAISDDQEFEELVQRMLAANAGMDSSGLVSLLLQTLTTRLEGLDQEMGQLLPSSQQQQQHQVEQAPDDRAAPSVPAATTSSSWHPTGSDSALLQLLEVQRAAWLLLLVCRHVHETALRNEQLLLQHHQPQQVKVLKDGPKSAALATSWVPVEAGQAATAADQLPGAPAPASHTHCCCAGALAQLPMLAYDRSPPAADTGSMEELAFVSSSAGLPTDGVGAQQVCASSRQELSVWEQSAARGQAPACTTAAQQAAVARACAAPSTPLQSVSAAAPGGQDAAAAFPHSDTQQAAGQASQLPALPLQQLVLGGGAAVSSVKRQQPTEALLEVPGALACSGMWSVFQSMADELLILPSGNSSNSNASRITPLSSSRLACCREGVSSTVCKGCESVKHLLEEVGLHVLMVACGRLQSAVGS